MFTGIITDIGTISRAEQRGDLHLTIVCQYDIAGVAMGASIACSGACLTVVDKGVEAGVGGESGGWFSVEISAESISRTAKNMWSEGQKLNLERALKVGDELGGHIVTGHVDGVGTVISVEPVGESHKVIVAAPFEIAPYLAEKGSITMDGVSLTVNSIADQSDGSTHFTLNIIPHTAQETTLCDLAKGREVNLEIDILARYLKRMNEAHRPA
jgi:riboflavin synthase